MYDKSYLVRISTEQHAKFKQALSLCGGNMSGVTRNLVTRWADGIIEENGYMYGLRKKGSNDKWVIFFSIDAKNNVTGLLFGREDEAVKLQPRATMTIEYLEEIAELLGCDLVELD